MENFINNFDLSTLISAIITLLVSLYIFRNKPKYDLVLTRYKQLIFPLFNIIEPYLFKKINKKKLSELLTLIDENKVIAGNKLIELAYFCKISPTQDTYDSLCSQICKEYDMCCSKLGLKQRSFYYRYVRKQYDNTIYFYISCIIKVIFTFIIMSVVTIFIYIVLDILKGILNTQ